MLDSVSWCPLACHEERGGIILSTRRMDINISLLYTILGGGFKCFSNFHPQNLGVSGSNLTRIFCKWVGSTSTKRPWGLAAAPSGRGWVAISLVQVRKTPWSLVVNAMWFNETKSDVYVSFLTPGFSRMFEVVGRCGEDDFFAGDARQRLT